MPNSDLKLLGEKVRTERKLAGLTQEQLAERCHVSTKHIANIEKGSMNPSYEILLAIARVLPISLDALITPGIYKRHFALQNACWDSPKPFVYCIRRMQAAHLCQMLL